MRKRILIADDDPANRDILSRRLERRGYVTVTASDGEKALDALQGQPFDAVLLDSLMPSLSGLEVLRKMRAAKDSTRVIMVTGRAFHGDVEEAIADGADGYALKPVDFKKLVDLIEG